MLLIQRPRRNRKSAGMRHLVEESQLAASDLVAPLFVVEGSKRKDAIPSMPGQYRLGLDFLLEEVQILQGLGITAISLFPVVAERDKSPNAAEALNGQGFYLQVIRAVKESFPDMLVMTDVALDPYSSDGHDGLVGPKTGEILNDETLEILTAMALLQARAGSDIIGPSDMMDGRVGAIRQALDREGLTHTSIMSYTAKYASSFYGPFREALDSAPKKGDKKTYQMNPANVREAIREAKLDEREGGRHFDGQTGVGLSGCHQSDARMHFFAHCRLQCQWRIRHGQGRRPKWLAR